MNSDIFLSEDKTVLCLDEARRMLHISKRQCAELLKKGILPCTSTGKKTRQYKIRRSDVEALMNTQDALYSFKASAKTESQAKTAKPSIRPEEHRAQLEDLWYNAPDVLTSADIQKLTGYSQSYVSSLMVTGKLRTVTIHGSPITSREWLIDYMCEQVKKIREM